MRFAVRAWLWLKALLRTGRSPHDPAWVIPGDEVTRAIESGRPGALPALRPEFHHRPVTLADYPDLALALRELAAETIMPPMQVAPAPPTAQRERPAAERRQPSVSTRSARRRRHHRAA